MSNKHTPKNGSSNFGDLSHEQFKVQPARVFYKISVSSNPMGSQRFLLDEYLTEKEARDGLKYWRGVYPDNIYTAFKCEEII